VGPERRRNARLIKRVPVQILSPGEPSALAKSAEAMNISKDGLYFATDLELREGVQLELCLKVPDEITALPPLECRFLGRVAHVERLGPNGKSGVGVQFLYYSLD
jgi:PilZ domain